MFYYCSKLNSINVNFSAWNPTNATTNWVQNVPSSGTFTCPADLPEEFGTSRIPTGWTIVRK
jgi:surface protein